MVNTSSRNKQLLRQRLRADELLPVPLAGIDFPSGNLSTEAAFARERHKLHGTYAAIAGWVSRLYTERSWVAHPSDSESRIRQSAGLWHFRTLGCHTVCRALHGRVLRKSRPDNIVQRQRALIGSWRRLTADNLSCDFGPCGFVRSLSRSSGCSQQDEDEHSPDHRILSFRQEAFEYAGVSA